MTPRERRVLGRYDTPRPLAQAISNWAVRSRSDVVLEPSCGGGSIVRSIASRLESLGGISTQRQVVACDIDERAIQQSQYYCRPFDFRAIHADFLCLKEKDFGEARFDSIVANPPYTRLHDMSHSTRLSARDSLPHDICLPSASSLWAYFVLHAFRFLKTGGRMALILPEALLHVQYGKVMLDWFADNFKHVLVVSIRERCFCRDGAEARVVVVLCEEARVEGNGKIAICECATVLDFMGQMKCVEESMLSSLPTINGHAVPHLISGASDGLEALSNSEDTCKLGDVASVKIGVVTGDNRYFLFDDSRKRDEKLNVRHLKPIVTRFSDLDGAFTYTSSSQLPENARKWLLCPSVESKDQKLLNYLMKYPCDQREANQTMLKRAEWQRPVLNLIPDAFFQYMGNSAPRMVLNVGKAYCTNTIHGLYFEGKTKLSKKRAICLAIHSTYSQLSAELEGRQYGSGVLKLEPSEAMKIAIPMNDDLERALSKDWSRILARAQEKGIAAAVDWVDGLVVRYCSRLSKRISLAKAREMRAEAVERRRGTRNVKVRRDG